MATFLRSIRFRDWYDTKLAVLFSIFLVYKTHNNLQLCALVWVFMAAALGLGYVLNNLADWKTDTAKNLNRTRASQAMLKVTAFLFVGITIATCWIIGGFASLILGMIGFLVGAAYSLKPFRLKEKGIWGIISGAIGQRLLPILPVLPSLSSDTSTIVMLLAVLFMGIRAMFMHQIKDYTNDLESGTKTLVTNIGKDKAFTVVNCLIPIEVGSWAAWAVMQHSIPLLIGLAITIVLQIAFREGVSDTKFKLSGFYYWIFPVYAALSSDLQPWEIFVVLAALLVQQIKYLTLLLTAARKR